MTYTEVTASGIEQAALAGLATGLTRPLKDSLVLWSGNLFDPASSNGQAWDVGYAAGESLRKSILAGVL